MKEQHHVTITCEGYLADRESKRHFIVTCEQCRSSKRFDVLVTGWRTKFNNELRRHGR